MFISTPYAHSWYRSGRYGPVYPSLHKLSFKNLEYRNIHQESIQKKIIKILLDQSIKNVLVISHVRPDLDAYGSVVGISGILKSFGKKVYPVINDDPRLAYSKLPSPLHHVSASSFINTLQGVQQKINEDKIKAFDLVVITDSPEGKLLGNNTLNLVTQAKKVIIIDHHPDIDMTKPLKRVWLNELMSKGIHPGNVLYWRDDKRLSTSELIGELDKRIVELNRLGVLHTDSSHINPHYRLALAAGIVGDAGILNHKNIKKIKFNRLSLDKVQTENGRQVSLTRYVFNWLVENAGIPKKKVNLEQLIDAHIPRKYNKLLDKIVLGKVKVPAIDVKMPTKKDPLYSMYIKEDHFLHEFIHKINSMSKTAQLTRGDLMGKIKDKIEHTILPQKHLSLSVLIHKLAKQNGQFRISLRSIGPDMLHGERKLKRKIISDGLALKTVNHLNQKKLGEGGGHKNFAAFSLAKGKEFLTDILPEIKHMIESFRLQTILSNK